MSTGLQGDVVLLLGATGGIGRATATRLAEAGARLVLSARNEEKLRHVMDVVQGLGGWAHAHAADLTQRQEVESLVAETVKRFGRVDGVVHAAGAFSTASVLRQEEDDFDRQIAANLKSVYLVSRAVATPMITCGKGHIIVVLSVAARQAFAENAAYCASKWGALGFTKVLAEELRPRGVRVTAVLPGATDTPLWDTIPWAPDRSQMLRADDVAQVIVGALAAPASVSLDEIILSPPSGNI